MKRNNIIKRYRTRLTRLLTAVAVLALFPMLMGTDSIFAQSKNNTEDKHTSRYYVKEAEGYEASKQWEAAKKSIDAGLKLFPDDPDLRYLNGRYYYYAHRDLSKARYNLVKAIQESDHHWGARRVMIDVEDDAKRYSSAICYINELLEQQPYDRNLWRRKIALYNKMGNKVEADAALERLSRIYPNDSVVRRDLNMRNRENWNKRLATTTLGEKVTTLEQWINTDPGNLDYYIELSDLYIKMGDYEKALSAAKRGLVVFPKNSTLVNRAASLMSEQGLYTRTLSFLKENKVSGKVYDNAMRDAANDARLRDPYDITGRLYERTKDRDALTYLLNTSLTRGYYDDALMYLADAYKIYGRTQNLLMKEYDLHKRMGNETQSSRLLQELYQKNPSDSNFREQYIAMQMELANIDEEQQDWEDAYDRLTIVSGIMEVGSDSWAAVMSRRINLLGKMGRTAEARTLFAEASSQDPARRRRFADAYEDIVSKKIKAYIEDERYLDALNDAQELLGVITDSESALRACINMSQTLKRNDLFYKYAQMGYEQHPDQPYFIIKQALALQQQGQYAEALQLLKPQKESDLYPIPQLVAPYAGVSQDWATMLIKNKMPDIAIERIDDALVYDPDNTDLLYLKGLAYEQMHDFGKAYEYQSRYYNPSNAEYEDWTQHMRWLKFRSYNNRLDVNYLTAYYDTRNDELASIGHLYSIGSIAYSHLWKYTTLTFQGSYKATDGFHGLAGYETGGVGVEGLVQWDQVLNPKWSMMLNGSFGTKLFNKVGANLMFTRNLNRGWAISLKGGYRLTMPMSLYNQNGGYWSEDHKRYNLVLLSPSVEKSWEKIKLSGIVDLISLDLVNFYYNVSAKSKFFINEDNISSIGVMLGFGSFPELTFFDQTTMNGITHSNAMVGFEANYLFTRNFYASLAGNWNTYYSPSFTPEGYAVASYRNVYSLNLSVHLAF